MLLATSAVICTGTSCSTVKQGGADQDAVVGERALQAIEDAGRHLNRFVLDNGMTCLIKEDHSAPVVSIQFWVGTGSIHENEYLGAGLSHAIEHMIFKGTGKRGPTDITKDINNAGGDINAYTTLDRTVFHTDMPSRNWRVGLDVLSDALMNATFPEAEWKQEKNVILREFAMCNDDPDRVVDKLLWKTAFAVHPYRFPVIGYEDIFKKTTREDLVLFFKRNYVPDNIIIMIAGDVDSTGVEKTIRDTFAAFTRKARAPLVLPAEPVQLSPRTARETGPFKLSRLNWSYHTVAMSHPDAPALDLLAQITGAGRSSILVRRIQEEQQLVHNISSWSYTPKEAGLFGFSATFDPDREQAVITAIQKEVDSWAKVPFAQSEIEKARRMMLTSVLSQQQTMQGQANGYASGEFYTGNPEFAAVYLKKLNSITPEILRETVVKYLQPERKSIAVIAPAAAAAVTNRTAGAVTIPEARKAVTSNGITVILREDHRLPFVYFSAVLGGGLLSETSTNNGVTRLMSDLLMRGTATRSREQIAESVEALGASLQPFSGLNSFGLKGQCLDRDAGRFMDIFADCLLNSSFPAEEVERQKEIQLSSIEEEQERPIELARESLRGMLFEGHPYKWSALGRRETVSKLSPQDLKDHCTGHLVKSNIVISVFGDITPEGALALVEKHFAGISNGTVPGRICQPPAPKLPAKSKRLEPKEQAVVLVGFPGVDIKDARYDALQVLQTAISGLSSDLGIEVREVRGLAYYVGSFNQAGVEPGAFVFYAGTRSEAAAEVEKLITNEVARVSTTGLRKEEVDRARNQIIADFEMSLQDNGGTATSAALDELYGLGFQHAFNVRARYEAVTPEKVRDAAASILKMDRSATSILLPAGTTESGAKVSAASE